MTDGKMILHAEPVNPPNAIPSTIDLAKQALWAKIAHFHDTTEYIIAEDAFMQAFVNGTNDEARRELARQTIEQFSRKAGQ